MTGTDVEVLVEDLHSLAVEGVVVLELKEWIYLIRMRIKAIGAQSCSNHYCWLAVVVLPGDHPLDGMSWQDRKALVVINPVSCGQGAGLIGTVGDNAGSGDLIEGIVVDRGINASSRLVR